LFFLVVAAVAFNLIGCSKQEGPSDADVSKTIQATVEDGLKGNTLKSPVVIIERGKKLPSGDWPVKVEYTIGMKDGSTKKETITYNFSPSIDAMGANVWLAVPAK
jgi:hypothetical protein